MQTVNYEITIVAKDLTVDILKWYVDIGGQIAEKVWYNMRGNEVSIPIVAYGRGRASHKMQNDSGEYLIRFQGEDAGVALIFLMKFSDYVISHNMKEEDRYAY